MVWGSGANVYFSGSTSVFKWNGTTWTSVFKDPFGSPFLGQWLDGPAANDLWTYGSTLAHFDGTTWTTSPASALAPDFHTMATLWLQGSTPLAIRHFSAPPQVERWTGTSWKDERIGDGSFTLLAFASHGAQTWLLGQRTSAGNEMVLLYRGP